MNPVAVGYVGMLIKWTKKPSWSNCGEPSVDVMTWIQGLPVSRLHARYLGGQLQLTTYPGPCFLWEKHRKKPRKKPWKTCKHGKTLRNQLKERKCSLRIWYRCLYSTTSYHKWAGGGDKALSDLRCIAEPVWWVAVVKPATFACTATSLVSAWPIDLKQWSHAKLKRTFFACLFVCLFVSLFRVQHCSKPLLDLDMPQLQCFFNAGAKAPACCLGQAARAWRGKINTKLKRKERLLPLPQLDHCWWSRISATQARVFPNQLQCWGRCCQRRFCVEGIRCPTFQRVVFVPISKWLSPGKLAFERQQP